MKFIIEDKVFEKFPNLVVTIPVILGFDNKKSADESVTYLREQERNIQKQFTWETLEKDIRITAYSEVFRKFGVDPNNFLPAHIALAKRVLEGGLLPDINPIVNFYNAQSLKYITPFGGEDLDTVYGDFVLKFAEGGEPWIPIGGKISKPAVKGELIWQDDIDASTRALNWRQGERTKLTGESKNGYFIMDGFSDVNKENIETAANEFIEIIKEKFGGNGKLYRMDKDHREVILDFQTKSMAQMSKIEVEKKMDKGLSGELADKLRVIVASAASVRPEEIKLEHPDVDIFGDFSTNIALMLKGGRKLAEEIAAKIKPDNLVEKVEVAGPGFINIFLKPEVFLKELEGIDGNYGKSKLLNGKKIMVEFAHPNTHKELHIGHMRTLVTGEALARILSNAGASVFRANYQGDIGPHVAKAIWGTTELLTERKMAWEEADKLDPIQRAHLLGEGYVRGNQVYEEKKTDIDNLNYKIYAQDPGVMKVYELTRGWSLKYYDIFYKRFGTNFDRLFFESEVAEEGKRIVLENIGGVFAESEGAVIFDGEKYGLHKRVFVTGDGNPTYEGKEMALAVKQYTAFPFDRNIHVVANEQTGYFQVVIKAIELVNPQLIGREYHLPMGMVNLIGRKIASRTGDIITVDGLLEDIKAMVRPLINSEKDKSLNIEEIAESVTLAAVKYSVLKTHPTLNVAFDIKQSISLEGNSGPYLQYTYARANSVLIKSQITDNKPQVYTCEKYNLNSEEAKVVKTLHEFEEVTDEAAEKLCPNLVCNYLYKLAQGFNTFYNQHSILSADNMEQIRFRVKLTETTAMVLKNGLNLLGIDVLEKM